MKTVLRNILWLVVAVMIFVGLPLRAHFDQKRQVTMGWTLRGNTFDWSDLEGSARNDMRQDMVLYFSRQRSALVSLFLNNVSELVAFAHTKPRDRQLA